MIYLRIGCVPAANTLNSGEVRMVASGPGGG